MNRDLPGAETLFVQAIGIESAAERAAFLEQACGSDAKLRKEVEKLVGDYFRAGAFLEKPAVSGLATVDESPAGEGVGTLIGPYKLVQEIGEGGMGTVWMARQTEPVKRLVALKVIKPGMDSKQVPARFEAERQALALMDHPNIAKVHDAGTTATGTPYFVMELVKGVPITRYCDDHRLTPKQRLELFVPVCQAVQHAHQKGIIHRDIKPSNVLVASYDGLPVPKVIDFGIAKATGQQLTEKTLVTGFGTVVGTLEYMSPEQAELNQLDIDTRSDVYSLGVLLYELLTGTTPLERKRLKETGLLEVLRIIREEEAPTPSIRLSTTDELSTVAANRGMEPRKLSGLVRGELDWIVMKALDKDRNRRYETANGFAMDVQRYLADEPVLACPPSAGYRLRKFVRRNRGPVLAVAVVLLALVGGVVGTTTGMVQATLAKRETSKALDQAKAAQTQTREALDVLIEEVVEKMFAKQPELDEAEKAFLRKVLGHYEAVALEVADTAESRLLRTQGYCKVARMHELIGDQREAVKGYELARGLLEELAEEFPKVTEYRHKLAQTNHDLAALLAVLHKEAEAEEAFLAGIVLFTKLAHEFPKKGQYRSELGHNYTELAYLLERQRRYEEAEKHYHAAIGWHEKLVAQPDALPAYHQQLAHSHSRLGQLLRKQGKYAQAEKLFDQAVKVQQEQLKKFPDVPRYRRDLADSYQWLGALLAQVGREDEAETMFEQCVSLHKKLVELFPRMTRYRRELASAYNDLAYLQSLRKKFADAEKTYRLALDVLQSLVAEAGAMPAYLQLQCRCYTNLGQALQDQKKDLEAERAYRDSLKLDRKLITDFPRAAHYRGSAAHALIMLARLNHERKAFDAAVPLLTEARAHLKAALVIRPKFPPDRELNRDNLRLLAKSYLMLADHARLAATGNDLAGFGYEPPNDTFDAATMLSSCVLLVNKDTQLDEATRKMLAQTYTERALALLHQAIKRGFKDAGRMQKDPRLAPLRERPEYGKLLTELKAKKK
jgi:serine/threonine protein kinase/tetratricopeptide (TPR) repeat protein